MNKNTLLFVIIVSLLSTLAFSQDNTPVSLSVDQFMEIMSSAEKNCSTVKYECKIEHFLLNQGIDSTDIKEKKIHFEEHTVLYEIKTGKFHVQSTSLTPWAGGNNNFYSVVYESIFDGKAYYEWERGTGGRKQPPPTQSAIGTVSLEPRQLAKNFISTSGFNSGFGVGGTPYFPFGNGIMTMSKSLAEWKKAGFQPVITQNDNGDISFEIKVNIEWLQNDDRVIRMVFHKGKMISYQRVSQFNNKEYEEVRIEVNMTTLPSGIEAPKVVKYILPLDKMMSIYTYTNYQVQPSDKPNDYKATFPDGTHVEDFITKMYYKVGSPVNEDKAMDDFISRNDPSRSGQYRPRQTSNTRRYLLMGAGLILIGIACYRIVQKRRKTQR